MLNICWKIGLPQFFIGNQRNLRVCWFCYSKLFLFQFVFIQNYNQFWLFGAGWYSNSATLRHFCKQPTWNFIICKSMFYLFEQTNFITTMMRSIVFTFSHGLSLTGLIELSEHKSSYLHVFFSALVDNALQCVITEEFSISSSYY